MDDIILEIAGDMLWETEEVVDAAGHLVDGGAARGEKSLADRVFYIRNRIECPETDRDGPFVRCLSGVEVDQLADAAGLVIRASSDEGRLWRSATRVLDITSSAQRAA